MSATNTTTNYSLPIFISSDKPAWLVDFNGAMNAIDAQMKTNADAIATKSPILTFNDTTEIDFTKTGNVITATLASGVSDKVGRALVTPISAPASEQLVTINTSGVQAAAEIGSGLYNDGGVLKAVDLNLDDITTITASADFRTITGTYTSITPNVTIALNNDKSIGKVYGSLDIRRSSGEGIIEMFTGINVTPTSAFAISPAGINEVSNSSGSTTSLTTPSINISATGEISIRIYAKSPVNSMTLMPCIYFFKDFGDVPVNP